MPSGNWIVCQLGAREHYAIPRALHETASLDLLLTDAWCPPNSILSSIPGSRRLQDRYHPDLHDATIRSFTPSLLAFEGIAKFLDQDAWKKIIKRNNLFQRRTAAALANHFPPSASEKMTCFSYSYTALLPFREAAKHDCLTVLGQIDPGPEEERIVKEEHERYPHFESTWDPAPEEYWNSWTEEINIADHIIVNSKWSHDCLVKSGIPSEKIAEIPLAYSAAASSHSPKRERNSKVQILFLGTICLRKGIARLLEAMKSLEGSPVELVLAGPTEIDPRHWSSLSNVRWIGSAPRGAVSEIYRSADIFVLPTLSDGFALTQLEALAHGLPVVASKHCGSVVRDRENGWLLDDLDPETIATTLLTASREFRDIPLTNFQANSIAGLAQALTNLE